MNLPDTKPLYRPETNELLTYEDAQRINPLIEINSDEAVLNAAGFFRIQEEVDGQLAPPATTTDPYSEVVEIPPILIAGQYLRQYEVLPLFTSAYTGIDGQIVTIAMQQAAYDQAQLAVRKMDLIEQARLSHAAALMAGMTVTLPDSSQVLIELTDASALQRYMHRAGGAATRTLISVNGPHSMPTAAYAGICDAADEYQSGLTVRLAEVIAEIEALPDLVAASNFDPTVTLNG